MIDVLIVGAFGFDTLDTGGQPVKSRELYNALFAYKDKYNVDYLETKCWKKHPARVFLSFIKKAKKSESIIMMPAHNGLHVFSFLLCLFKRFLKKKIYYSVIGGWLVDTINSNHILVRRLKQFDGIWVETSTMQSGLLRCGIPSIVVPNFKSIRPLKKQDFGVIQTPPFSVCFFSRVMKEKGVQIAIDTIIRLNSEGMKYNLDIYGSIDSNYAQEFHKIINQFPDYISYKGFVESKDSVNVLKKYYLLLFPTLFYTEGIPGTLVDALFSGLPVVCSKWMSFSDVVDEGVTGFGYDFDDKDGLYKQLKFLYSNPSIVNKMRQNCVNKARFYTPEYSLSLMNI